jgi:hypothetical protein
MPTQFDHRITNIERCVHLPAVSTSTGARFAHRPFDYSHRPVIDAHKIRSQLINSIRHAAA